MHNMFARIIVALLWLEKRLARLAKHPLGRVGLVVFFVLTSMFSAHLAHAKDEPSGPGFPEVALLFIAGLGLDVAVMLSKLVVAIIQILLPVMQYNSFSTSPVVTAGWAIVRDTVNMFFVIVLIAIAFGTIFSYQKYKWNQMVPKLMVFAIVINFSKTICGLAIDAGQVVMLTFANAIREIAAGNFVQMFGMGDVYSLSTNNSFFSSNALNASVGGAKAFDYFASAMASVFMMFIVLTTMIMLLGILLYRVVMLWVLIVISPIAFFVGGASGVIKGDTYEKWKSRFVCLIVIGPVLTFFLWLTLVVAGAGNISDSAGFVATGDTAGGFLTGIFELNKLISFVIAIAMLFAGFEAANGVCSDSFIGGMLKGGPTGSGGVRAAKAVAGLGARLGAKGGRIGASAARAGYNNAVVPLAQYGAGKIDNSQFLQNRNGALASAVKATTSKGREDLYRKVAANAGSGMIGQAIGRKALARAEGLGSERAALMATGMEKYKGDSAESKNDTLRRLSENASRTPAGKREEMALMMDAMGDDKRMKELRASGTWDKMWARNGKDLESNAKGDKTAKARVDAYKKSNADLTGSWPDAKGDPKEATKQANTLSAFALSDKDARQKLDGISSGVKKPKKDWADKNVPEEYLYVEALEKKLIGNKEQQDAFNIGRGSIYEGMKPEELGRIPATAIAENLTPALIDKSLNSADGPKIGGQLLASNDSNVRAALTKRVQADKTGALSAFLGKAAGLQFADGKLTGGIADAKIFAGTLGKSPTILDALSDEDFEKLMKSDRGNPKIIADELAKDNGSIQSHVGDIKSRVAQFQALQQTIQNGSPQEKVEAQKQFDELKASVGKSQERMGRILEAGSNSVDGAFVNDYYKAQMKTVNQRAERNSAPKNTAQRIGNAAQDFVINRTSQSDVDAAIDNIGKEDELRVISENAIDDSESEAENRMKWREELEQIQPKVADQINSIASSPLRIQQLQEEDVRAQKELESINDEIANIYQGKLDLDVESNLEVATRQRLAQERIAQINTLKTRVEEARAKLEAAKKTP